jgi:hypothetical protein
MIPFAAFSAVVAATWFGPAQVSFDAAVQGNPYDFRANDVRVVFTAADGHREERLAYYDAGRWSARLTASAPGTYQATLVRNGSPVDVPSAEVRVAETARLPGGFVRVDGTRFRLDSGAVFFPLGYNLAWRGEGQLPLPEHLRRMGAAGLNWTRVWACAWDGKNPFFGHDGSHPVAGELVPEVMVQWDEIVAAAEAAGVRLQFVLFHHGLVSTWNDSNWAGHPWNRANGGFLDRPQQFFTDATAKEYQQRWLRYAVARWGHSPAVMAWELFNEVEWVDAAQIDRDWPTVVDWHAEMAAFLRNLDPYRHLVTTSAAREHPELYRAMDYFQPHTYPRDVFNGIAGVVPHPGKPWFFGEFGRGTSEQNADEPLVVRDGLWAGVLSGHAGAAQYWFWDRVLALGLEPEFRRAVRVLEFSGFVERTGLRPMPVAVVGAPTAPRVVAPGQGAPGRYRYDLPADASPEKLAAWSSYLEPSAGEDAAWGSGLRPQLDGREAEVVRWPAANVALSAAGGRAHQLAPELMEILAGAGADDLRLEGAGPDWSQIERGAGAGQGSSAAAHAIGGPDFALVRLVVAPSGLGAAVDLRVEGLADGAFRLRTFDLGTGEESERAVAVAAGTLRGFCLERNDVALVLMR